MSFPVRLLTADATAPTRGSPLSAGYDVYASENTTVPANGRVLVSTGLAVVCPENTYARVAPRSGLAVKAGISTGAGVVDADYRGEVKVLLFNHSNVDFTVNKGDRIAQLILERIVTPDVVVLDDKQWENVCNTERGAGGFGSTGTN
ncbi:bifunctional dITP/dUTP diphosphatase [Pichia kluyveri]|uniref:Deoxyuridine 5'-triphosphate nucleotidohydrolase n=1 Tax=Pichia kluyveri TaxID=36015 RepID=A0AAV5QXR9_PICKL|nr:bifunctional dITP/dUTP diphosphatase [Pichia kluyveri]